jgi:hypothetical protein
MGAAPTAASAPKTADGSSGNRPSRILNGILWLLHTGAPWRNPPKPSGAVKAASVLQSICMRSNLYPYFVLRGSWAHDTVHSSESREMLKPFPQQSRPRFPPSTPQRQAYQSTRVSASVAVWTAPVINNSHSIESVQAGGASSSVCTAHSGTAGNLSC